MPATKAEHRGGPVARERPRPGPRPWPAVLAWALFALVLLLFATFPLARPPGPSTPAGPTWPCSARSWIPPTVAALTASTVGVVLASRRPRHPVGWLLLAHRPGHGLRRGVIVGYLPYAADRPPRGAARRRPRRPDLPAVTDAALAAVGFVLLLTPTGSPPSPRWRRWASGLGGRGGRAAGGGHHRPGVAGPARPSRRRPGRPSRLRWRPAGRQPARPARGRPDRSWAAPRRW